MNNEPPNRFGKQQIANTSRLMTFIRALRALTAVSRFTSGESRAPSLITGANTQCGESYGATRETVHHRRKTALLNNAKYQACAPRQPNRRTSQVQALHKPKRNQLMYDERKTERGSCTAGGSRTVCQRMRHNSLHMATDIRRELVPADDVRIQTP